MCSGVNARIQLLNAVVRRAWAMLAVHMGRLGVPDLMTCFTPLRLLHLTLVVNEPILRHTVSCLVNLVLVF